ncbi:hypothetical protein N9924_00630 [bacterium]|nr:hypothetical protein [bacterium]
MDIETLHQELVAEAEQLKAELATVQEKQNRLAKITNQAQALHGAMIVLKDIKKEI